MCHSPPGTGMCVGKTEIEHLENECSFSKEGETEML